MSDHGYGSYSHGCRCQVCKDARAAYSRNQRAEAARRARPGQSVEGVKHGTRRAYKDRGCRCEQCVTAMRGIWRDWSRKYRQQEPAGAP
jgi:hypothetical protein